MLRNTLLPALLLVLNGCSGPDTADEPSSTEAIPSYQGEEATKARKETIVELLAIKETVQRSIESNRERTDLSEFVSELESLRPRLEYIKMQTSMLPKTEQRVILGNLAVATNQLQKDLDAILAAAPGDDDLAMEIANLRQQLNPIDLASLIQRQ